MAATDFSPGYIETFEANIYQLAQQKYSKLLPFVSQTVQNAKTDYYRRMGAVSSTSGGSKGGATTYAGATIDKRAVTLTRVYAADIISREDVIKLGGMDPSSEIVTAFAAEMGRQIDNYVVSSACGNASDGTNPISFDAGQVIAVDVEAAGTNTALTMAKIRKAVQLFDENEIPEGERIMVVTPGAMQSLLKDSTVTSADFNNIKPLVDGSLTQWMGFTWVKSNRVLVTSSTIDNCFAFHRPAVKLAFGEKPWTVIRDLPGKTSDKEVYTEMFLGGTRLEENAVVKILCDSSKY